MSPEGPASGHPITASVLFTDENDRILVVHPARRPEGQWALPGGLVEAGESPVEAARREIQEELGLATDIRTTDLMAVEWLEAVTPGRRARLALVFAGPRLSTADAEGIVLQRREITRWAWVRPDTALEILHPRVARRVRGPLQLPGSTLYLETRNERTP
ncbi:NUDIX hydrolase [Streptomyces sp. NBC_01476]|uniref:NUDIX domain-containing protein n=1 Tax=Streptomyces sp. NBC_01476 TaxID=2903881 RepID=UPI003244FA53